MMGPPRPTPMDTCYFLFHCWKANYPLLNSDPRSYLITLSSLVAFSIGGLQDLKTPIKLKMAQQSHYKLSSKAFQYLRVCHVLNYLCKLNQTLLV
jgi:hypothetical protein